jgi:hypothetical protein
MTRQTFVVHVRSEGVSTLENLATHERIRLPDLAAIGSQIERWLEQPAAPPPVPVASEEPAP